MHDQEVNQELQSTLVAAVGNLVRSLQPLGHWGDSRSTALAAWALAELTQSLVPPLPADHFLRTIVNDALIWLNGQARREEGGYSWDSEAWDTSMALIALNHDPSLQDRMDQGRAWLERIRCQESGVWYDEIWETTLSTVALIRCERASRRTQRALSPTLNQILHWINDLPSKQSGEFVNSHYSGFLAWLQAEILHSPGLVDRLHADEYRRFAEKTAQAVAWLQKRAADDPYVLWSPYTFANAYAAYALSRLAQHPPHADLAFAPAAVRWLSRQQGPEGGFEDTEDTSLAVLALTAMMGPGDRETARLAGALLEATTSKHGRTWTCFIGYTSSSSRLADEIRRGVSSRIPNLSIQDWKEDFHLGETIISEIVDKSRRCDAALFLVTSDDELTQKGSKVAAPRDNIVFEVGYFAGRLGFKHTLLIVDDAVKLPSDWGGIITIRFTDPRDVETIVEEVVKQLRKILRVRTVTA